MSPKKQTITTLTMTSKTTESVGNAKEKWKFQPQCVEAVLKEIVFYCKQLGTWKKSVFCNLGESYPNIVG